MFSRSVAQIATASMRTSTSARFGTGTGLSVRVSSPGSPSTQAFMVSGTGWLGSVFTPAGAYMESSFSRAFSGKVGTGFPQKMRPSVSGWTAFQFT